MGGLKAISIALCTCNGEKYLTDQLGSFLIQTLLPDEIVICDDASTDNTLQILRDFAKDAPFLVKIFQNPSKLGTIKNFEKAITICSGDVILLADQDDYWLSHKIETVMMTFDKHPSAGYVFSDSELTWHDLKLMNKRLWDSVGFTGSKYRNFIEGDQLAVMLKGGNFIYGNTMAFRSSLKSKILPIDSTSYHLTHDTWISLVLSSTGSHSVPINTPLIYYRQHSQQQAGAGKNLPINEKAKNLIRNKRGYFVEVARALFSVRNRILKINSEKTKEINMLDKCIVHLERRASLNSVSGITKIRIVLSEYLLGHYKLFSSSWKSVLKDLFMT